MEKDTQQRHWLQTFPGLITATAGLIGAITALVAAFGGNDSKKDESQSAPTHVSER